MLDLTSAKMIHTFFFARSPEAPRTVSRRVSDEHDEERMTKEIPTDDDCVILEFFMSRLHRRDSSRV